MNNTHNNGGRVLGRVLSKEQAATVAGGTGATDPVGDITNVTQDHGGSNTISERFTLTMSDGVFFIEN